MNSNFINNDKEKKNDNTICNNTLRSKLKYYSENNINVFCNSKKILGCLENENFTFCKFCFKDYCAVCDKICHQNCSYDKAKNNKNDCIPSHYIYEFASSCNCDHNHNYNILNVINNNTFNNLFCFYSKFLFEIFRIKKLNLFKNNITGKIKCGLCLNFHKIDNDKFDDIYEPIVEENYSKNSKCQTTQEECLSYNLLDFIDMLHWCYLNTPLESIKYSQLKEKFETYCLNSLPNIDNSNNNREKSNIFLGEKKNKIIRNKTNKQINFNLNNFKYDIEIKENISSNMWYNVEDVFEKMKKIMEYEKIKFCIDNIMNNPILVYTEQDEKDLLIIILEKLKNSDFLFFNNEKINFAFTFIFYFYRKYLFSKLYLLHIENVNLLNMEKRFKIHKNNKEIVDKLNNKSNEVKDKNVWSTKTFTFDIKNQNKENFLKTEIEMTDKKIDKIDNQIKKNNSENLEIDEKQVKSLFSNETIIEIFDSFSKLKDFAVDISDEKRIIPFPFYFLNFFVEGYFLNEITIVKLLNIITKLKYKRKFNDFNYYIRKYIDQIFSICQIYKFDLKIFLTTFDNLDEYEGKENSPKVIEIYQFIKYPDLFTKYFNRIFSNEFSYIPDSDTNKHNDNNYDSNQKTINYLKILKNLNNMNYNYLNSFHYNYLKKAYIDIQNFKYLKKKNTFSSKINHVKIYEKESDNTNNIDRNVFHNKKYLLKSFKGFDIPFYEKPSIQMEYLNYCFDSVFKEAIPNIDFSRANPDNQFEFLNYLICKYKKIFKNLKKNNSVNKEIDISKYIQVSEETKIYIDKINLKKKKNELLFIFHNLFVLEIIKKKEFEDFKLKWNLLLFFLICNRQNVLFLFLELNYLDFLFHEHKEDSEKKSFLIECLINKNKMIQENNFTWEFFYLNYKYFFEDEDELKNLQVEIFKNFICRVIDFYPKNTKNKNKLDKLLYDMNFSLIYYFLKIAKKLLILGKLNVWSPYNFNTNKFEVLEKLNIFANIVFVKKFDTDMYLKSIYQIHVNKLENKIKPSIIRLFSENLISKNHDVFTNFNSFNNISEELFETEKEIIFSSPIINKLEEYSKGKTISSHIKLGLEPIQQEKGLNIFKIIILENIQFLIFDILGNFYSTTDINIYFKIINENYKLFESLLMKNSKLIKNNREKESYLFKIEMIILRFIFNFLVIKHYDISEINILEEINITKHDLISFAEQNESNIIETEIDIYKDKLKSKFLITEMKIKLLTLIYQYLKNFNENMYFKKVNGDDIIIVENTKNANTQDFNEKIGKFLLNYFSLFLNDFKIKSENNLILFELESIFVKCLVLFFENIRKFFEIDISNELYLLNKNINFTNSNGFKINDENLDIYMNIFSSVFEKLDSRKNSNKKIEKNYSNVIGFDSNIDDYFKLFLEIDNRKHSKYSKMVNILITRKEKSTDMNEIIDFNEEYDIKIKAKEFQGMSFKLWENIYDIFNLSNSEIFKKLFDYLFNNLKIMEKIEAECKSLSFHHVFRENFLKIINLINNLLYYYSSDFQHHIKKVLDKNIIKLLLKYVLKLNNYIIGISEYENNEKLMSSSQIYFCLMDFFILLCEGMYNSKLERYFFYDLNMDEKYSQKKVYENVVENIKKNFNNNINKDEMIDDSKNQYKGGVNFKKKNIVSEMMKNTRNDKKYKIIDNIDNNENTDINPKLVKHQYLNNNFDLDYDKNYQISNNSKFDINLHGSIIYEDDIYDISKQIEVFHILKEKFITIQNENKNLNYKNKKENILTLLDQFFLYLDNIFNLILENQNNRDNIKNLMESFDYFKNIIKILRIFFEVLIDIYFTDIDIKNLESSQSIYNIKFWKMLNGEDKKIITNKILFEEIHNWLKILIINDIYKCEDNFDGKDHLSVDEVKINFEDEKIKMLEKFIEGIENFVLKIQKKIKKEEIQQSLNSDRILIFDILIYLRILDEFYENRIEENPKDILKDIKDEDDTYKKAIITVSEYEKENNNSEFYENEKINYHYLGEDIFENPLEKKNINNDNNINIANEKTNKHGKFSMFKYPLLKNKDEDNNKQKYQLNIQMVDNNMNNNSYFSDTNEKKFLSKNILKNLKKQINLNDLSPQLSISDRILHSKYINNQNYKNDNFVLNEENSQNNFSINFQIKNDKNNSEFYKNNSYTSRENCNYSINKDVNKDIKNDPTKTPLRKKRKKLLKNNNNFYYHSFLQMKNIIKIINKKNYKGFFQGSSRLILQFLYLTRFLKEFLEISKNNKAELYVIIIDCFTNHFDLDWLFSDNIENQEFSYVIRFQLLTLVISFLEENSENLFNSNNNEYYEFSNRLLELNYKSIIYEIEICFDKSFRKHFNEKKDKNNNKKKFEDITYQELKWEYINDEKSIYKNEYFELAELYYKLLRSIYPLYNNFLENYEKKYKTHKKNNDSNDLMKKLSKLKKIIKFGSDYKEKKDLVFGDINKKTKFSDNNYINENDYDNEKSVININFHKLLKNIGREIEVNFQEEDKTECSFTPRKIYFFKSPKCFWLSNYTKKEFIEETPRDSIGQKLYYLNKNLDLFLLNINVNYVKKITNFKLFGKRRKDSEIFDLDKLNFVLTLLINIYLLYYYDIDVSSKKNDLNFQLRKSEEVMSGGKRSDSLYMVVILCSIVQSLMLLFWRIHRYFSGYIALNYEEYKNDKFLLRENKTSKFLASRSLTIYDEILTKYENVNEDFFRYSLFPSKTFFCDLKIKIRAVFYSTNFYIIYSLILNIAFIFTNYKMLLVFPIISIITLYGLFGDLVKAVLYKYREFIALLVFIYIVQYIFSWITYLHLPNFLIYNYLERGVNLNESVKNFYILLFKLIFLPQNN